MKKHLWRRILTAGCVASLFMTSPGMAVLAGSAVTYALTRDADGAWRMDSRERLFFIQMGELCGGIGLRN